MSDEPTRQEIDALLSVIDVLKPTEERDVTWLLDLLASAKTEEHRRADVALFRNQLIQVAAAEMYSRVGGLMQ